LTPGNSKVSFSRNGIDQGVWSTNVPADRHWRLAMAMYSGSATSSVVVLNDKLGLPDARFVIKDDSAVIFGL